MSRAKWKEDVAFIRDAIAATFPPGRGRQIRINGGEDGTPFDVGVDGFEGVKGATREEAIGRMLAQMKGVEYVPPVPTVPGV